MNKRASKTNYPKRDIYINGKYICTTTWAKTNNAAKLQFLATFPHIPNKAVTVKRTERVNG